EWFRKWFHPERLDELIYLRGVIDAEKDSRCHAVLLVAFSDIVRAASNAHGGYPNVMFDRDRPKPASAIPRFLKRMDEIAEGVIALNGVLTNGTTCSIESGDASRLTVPPNSVDAVITHPPYIGSIPYAEYGLISLKWLGHDPREL